MKTGQEKSIAVRKGTAYKLGKREWKMGTINTVTLHGRLTADPELRYTAQGIAVASGSLAVDDGYGDRKKTYFFVYQAWRGTAEYLSRYARKGMALTISGKLVQHTWQNETGQNRSSVVVQIAEAALPPKTGGTGQSEMAACALGSEIVFDDQDLPF